MPKKKSGSSKWLTIVLVVAVIIFIGLFVNKQRKYDSSQQSNNVMTTAETCAELTQLLVEFKCSSDDPSEGCDGIQLGIDEAGCPVK